jgi:hypothetical protein
MHCYIPHKSMDKLDQVIDLMRAEVLKQTGMGCLVTRVQAKDGLHLFTYTYSLPHIGPMYDPEEPISTIIIHVPESITTIP